MAAMGVVEVQAATAAVEEAEVEGVVMVVVVESPRLLRL